MRGAISLLTQYAFMAWCAVKAQGIGRIMTEVMQVGGNMFHSEIHKFINY
jgi:hypothetical protein